MDPSATFRIDSHPSGTLELVDRLLRLSRAQLQLNTRVTSIRRTDQGQYVLVSKRGNNGDRARQDSKPFDVVIIASHLQKTGLQFLFDPTSKPMSHFPFSERHITHFTTPLNVQLSPGAFNTSSPDDIPDIIYTTAPHELGIHSIEHAWVSKGLEGGDVMQYERLFKIVSSGEISDSVFAQLLGHPEDTSLQDMNVNWVHRQVWPLASPQKVTGPQLDNIALAPALFYTGVAEELLPTMEMNCRVARKAAGMVFGQLWKRQSGG